MNSEPIITMSISRRIYEKCQLDACAGEYGLTETLNPGRLMFTGPVSAWRKLANDVDERSGGGYDPTCATYRSDGLHGRIDKHIRKMESAA